ncbi:MAG TPA: FecR domain-containing protein [Bacteroides reticulotermitis]|nr:FecR domain-containing protein [Bacteroides reticulotermitis]
MSNKEGENIDYILEILTNPALEQTPEFAQWIQKKANRRLYMDAKAAHDSLALEEMEFPDVSNEWDSLKQDLHESVLSSIPLDYTPKPFRKTSYWRWGAVAAMLILGSIIPILLPVEQPLTHAVALMHELTTPQEVILSSTNGQEITLSTDFNRDSLVALGVNVSDQKAIEYQNRSYVQAKAEIHTLKTPRGKDFKITLSDGTEVWLNTESTLYYPVNFVGEERMVELEGEAYFKVAKDEKHPFIVKTKNITTRVLGTSFNIKDYAHSDSHLTLVEGKVEARGKRSSIMLHPAQDACFNTDGTINVQKVDTRLYTSWIEGYFYFEDASLSDIMRDLGRWYNLTIEFADARQMNYHFTFWANRKADIGKALELLNQLGKVEARLEKNTVIINNK